MLPRLHPVAYIHTPALSNSLNNYCLGLVVSKQSELGGLVYINVVYKAYAI